MFNSITSVNSTSDWSEDDNKQEVEEEEKPHYRGLQEVHQFHDRSDQCDDAIIMKGATPVTAERKSGRLIQSPVEGGQRGEPQHLPSWMHPSPPSTERSSPNFSSRGRRSSLSTNDSVSSRALENPNAYLADATLHDDVASSFFLAKVAEMHGTDAQGFLRHSSVHSPASVSRKSLNDEEPSRNLNPNTRRDHGSDAATEHCPWVRRRPQQMPSLSSFREQSRLPNLSSSRNRVPSSHYSQGASPSRPSRTPSSSSVRPSRKV